MGVNSEEKTKSFKSPEAVFEASRCIECDSAPCVKACPVEVDIPRFIGRIKMGDFIGANKIIKEKCYFSGVCGYVCPAEKLCVQNCCITEPLGPVKINQLQQFVAEYEIEHKDEIEKALPKKINGKKIGILGAGPAGLSAAFWLAEKGYQVTVYESKEFPGGMMTYGIPQYRLPRKTLLIEINDKVKELGIKIRTSATIGIKELIQKAYDSILISTGTWSQVSLKLPGINLTGVFQGLDFLRLVNDISNKKSGTNPVAEKKVAIIGGGDVAMDAAISAVNFGAKRTFLIYRRSFEEMPAIPSEIKMAKEKGVMFWVRAIPKKIIGDNNGNVKKIECIETKLGKPDKTGRKKPIPVPETVFQLDVDIVIEAIGQKVEDKSIKIKGLRFNPNGTIKTNKNRETSIPGIFAAGDVISGGSTVVQAIAEGVEAAIGIDKYLNNNIDEKLESKIQGGQK
ncbi:NAD-dependent dihydropyrimidine dehydrogenase subunit PreT [subsurface metagenome]